MPDVTYDNGTFKMYYSGQQSPTVRVLYAESSNGIQWGNFSLALDLNSIGAGVDDTHAFNSMTLGSRLWYTAVSGSQYRIGTCSGAFTGTLSDCRLSIDAGNEGNYDTFNVAAGDVFRDIDVSKIWYSGSQSGFNYDIIYCESSDEIAWSNCLRSITRGSEGTYDTQRVSLPSVLVEDGVGKVWYTGYDGTSDRILYAESR